ncbi:unnamed protein product [Phyllotreta striolata]|uniref:Multiple inositol polyphosphate phosphatase 1 n=1 Tax=Phyllotreta striolata TaxID=444603 RepID=A0A9N9TUL0_PHYSR|nr:unnamed protein product [Phyllotreta striolata]
MTWFRPISLCILLPLIAAQLNYPNDNQNYNYNNNPNNYNSNYPNYNSNNSNYSSSNPNYNPNYNPNNSNYNSNNPNSPNYNPNYNSNNPNYPNNPNYNSNYNNPYNPNYNMNNPNNPNYNPNYNTNNPNNPNYYNSNNQDYNRNNQDYNRNNQDYNRNNQDYNRNNQDYNRNNQDYNRNNPGNSNLNYNNPSFVSQPLDQSDCCEEYCYSQDPEPYLYFGTKTAYDSISRRGGNQHVIPDCTPVQFWSIIRHGTRLPDVDTIRSMRNMNRIHAEITRNYEQRKSFPDRGRLCPQDYDLFRKWHFNESINEGLANTLTRQGVEDLKLLARRYKTKYPDLLQNYDERTHYFQYSTDDRTHDSFQAYIEGLFEQDAFRVHANMINGERLTNPFQNCPRWQQDENARYYRQSESQRFKEKSDYQKLVRDVFRRLGFRFSLNSTVIDDMYELCAYEKAFNPQPKSAWCIAFNKEQLKIMEYIEDLKYFNEYGYGNPLAEKIGCSSLKDMYERFERTVNGNSDGNKAAFIFGDTASFLSTLSAIGANKDYSPLNAENYYQQSRRTWRTSTMSPFSANLVASLYQCNRGEKYRVMFFLNEIPVEFPDCSVGLCNWSTIQQKYQDLVRSCNAESMCNGRGSAASYYAEIAVLFVTLLFALKM